MADAPPPALSTSGVASRFVSSSALEEAKQRREQEWKAAYERIGQEPPKQEDEGTYDPRSLFEKLQENKSKKQEAFEEQLKFKNHFRALDEDEISFLDSMIDDTNEEEREKKRLEAEELKGFRAAVHKRVAPPPPPSALAASLSPPLPAASTSSASAAPAATSSSSTANAAAPKPAAVPPRKKGAKRKTLPGVVVGKKKAPAPTPAKAASPTMPATDVAQEEKDEAQAEGARASLPAGSSAAAARTKRGADGAEKHAGGEASPGAGAGTGAADLEGVTTESGAKKRRVEEGEGEAGGDA